MILLANIFEDGALFAAGVAICFTLLWWRERNLQRARALETQALLDKARNEAESIKRDATAAASQEALQLRQQIEQSFADRRAERAESERRLGERETLINSQLHQMMAAEKELKEKKDTLETQTTAVEAGKREVEELKSQARTELQRLAGITSAEAREALLKAVEQEALNDASHLALTGFSTKPKRAPRKRRARLSASLSSAMRAITPLRIRLRPSRFPTTKSKAALLAAKGETFAHSKPWPASRFSWTTHREPW